MLNDVVIRWRPVPVTAISPDSMLLDLASLEVQDSSSDRSSCRRRLPWRTLRHQAFAVLPTNLPSLLLPSLARAATGHEPSDDSHVSSSRSAGSGVPISTMRPAWRIDEDRVELIRTVCLASGTRLPLRMQAVSTSTVVRRSQPCPRGSSQARSSIRRADPSDHDEVRNMHTLRPGELSVPRDTLWLITLETIWICASGNVCSSSSPSRRYSFSSIVTMSTESSGLSSSLRELQPSLHEREPLGVAVVVVGLDVVVVVLPVLRARVVWRVDVDGVDLPRWVKGSVSRAW